MKKAVVFVAAGGLLLSGIGLGPHAPIPAFGAELDGFAINTQDKAVTITLYTDQRVPYTTEHQGKQFTIILPETQLSQQQMNNGLPVVIDNKNRFIGRAVPTEDGKVKIILPNLPASDYSVSIQQKRPGQPIPTAANTAPAENIKPRPAVSPGVSSNFEQVAANFPKPVHRNKVASKGNASRTGSLKLSPGPHRVATTSGTGNGSVWNPYVVKTPSVPAINNSPYSNYRPVPQSRQALSSITDQPINTVSVAESMANPSGLRQNFTPNNAGPVQPANDPLWYLHSLPPANSGNPADTLEGPAADSQVKEQVTSTAQKAPSSAASAPPKLTLGLKEAITALPKWLMITLAVFLGGIGIFTFIGGLVLLRVLFSQAKQQFLPQAMYMPGMQPPMAADGNASNGAPGKSGYATQPNGMSPLGFQDKAVVNSMNYLKESPGNIAQAVQNAVLVKFPAHKKHRGGARRTANARQTGTTAAYGLKP